MSSEPRYLIGELVELGAPEGGEGEPRAIVACTVADIQALKQVPMYQQVALVPLDRLHGSAVPPIVEENRRLREKVKLLAEIQRVLRPGWLPVETQSKLDAALAANQVPTEHTEDTEAATTKDTKDTNGLTPVSSWLVCPTCRKCDQAELYPSKTDRTGYTIYCRRCEEGCVSPLEFSVVEKGAKS